MWSLEIILNGVLYKRVHCHTVRCTLNIDNNCKLNSNSIKHQQNNIMNIKLILGLCIVCLVAQMATSAAVCSTNSCGGKMGTQCCAEYTCVLPQECCDFLGKCVPTKATPVVITDPTQNGGKIVN